MAEIEITTMTAVERTGIKQNIAGIETITTGAAPVAADPDKTLTYIITGGTGDTETITLALPADPDTKLGLRKKFFAKTVTNENDNPAIDNTNLVNAESNQLDASHLNFSRANNWVEFELIFTNADVYAWQIITEVNQGERRVHSAVFKGGDGVSVGSPVFLRASGPGGSVGVFAADSATGPGGSAFLSAGASDVGKGGSTDVSPAPGATDGGDFICVLPAAGSGRQSLVIVRNMPTSDPLVDDAWWLNGGVVTKSAGTPP